MPDPTGYIPEQYVVNSFGLPGCLDRAAGPRYHYIFLTMVNGTRIVLVTHLLLPYDQFLQLSIIRLPLVEKAADTSMKGKHGASESLNSKHLNPVGYPVGLKKGIGVISISTIVIHGILSTRIKKVTGVHLLRTRYAFTMHKLRDFDWGTGSFGL